MTAVPAGTSLHDAIALVRPTITDTTEIDLADHWLIYPTQIENETEANEINNDDSVLQYPTEWVSPHDQPLSTPANRRRWGWVAANGLAFGIAYWWEPTRNMSWEMYHILGGIFFGSSIGIAQWAALRDRLNRPKMWLAIAFLGQMLLWLMYFTPINPIYAPLFGIGIASLLHIVFNREVIKRPGMFAWLYPLMWMLSWLAIFILRSFTASGVFVSGVLIAGLLLGWMTSFSMNWESKR